MQAQPQVATRGQDRMRIWGKAGQQPGELGKSLRRIQLVQIINHQCDAVGGIGEFREHSVDHRLPIEVGCRCWRFHAAGCPG